MQTVTEEPIYFPSTMTESLNHPTTPITSDDHHLHQLHINTDMNDDNNINNDLLYEKKVETPSTMFMKRSSLTKAERRAEHNAIERARRENLNGKFQQLAESLPNLQSYRRPSKGQIVEKALDWVKQSVAKEDRYQYQIHQLQRENKRLIMQLNMNQSSSFSNNNNNNNNNNITTIPSPSSSSSTFIHSNQHSPVPPFNDYNNNNKNNMNNNDTSIDDSIHPFMIPPPPQLITSPYSIGTNSRRGSAIIDDDDDPEFTMDHPCQVPIMPTSTTPIPPDFYFYNDIVTTNNNNSNPNTISMNTNWSKMNFSTPYNNNQGLIHPTEMPL